MTADVRVRRCSLTIRRRDGWSWGADPRAHLDAALVGVEAALQSAVVEAGLDPTLEACIDGPVRLEIGSDGSVTMATWSALVEQLRALGAEPRAGAPEPDAPRDEPAQDPAGTPRDATAGDATASDTTAGDAPAGEAGRALARTLARWSRGGQTARVVRGWPRSLVDAWIEAVAVAPREPRGAGAVASAPLSAEAVARIAAAVLGDGASGAQGRAGAERLLVLLAALTAALGDRLPDAATQALARAQVAGSETAADAAPRMRAPADGAAHEPGRDAAPVTAPAPPEPTAQIVPALPLLVLAELARIGYVDAMQAAAEAAALPGGAAALAAALAGKVLPPPARGWEREPAELAAIALASGRATARGTEGLVAAARAAGALLAPLASALQAAYAESRSSHDDVLVTTTADGILVGEEAGLLPIAWVATEEELGAVLDALGRPAVRRTQAFAALAQSLGERLALPRCDAPALERHLGAAAGTALGLLALDLWGGASAGAATPLLALERLGDLDARVQATPDGLVVAIPRGQRWLDLRRGGLLQFFAVPWLPGGRLEIATW